jgi:hypothetical protein
VETFVKAKTLEPNPGFQKQKEAILSGFASVEIDPPLVGLIAGLNKLSGSFTLQCCFGHFLHKANRDPMNTEALPNLQDIRRVDYKIAYLAFCLDESPSGRELYRKLEGLTAVDPGYIQFGSALWFWERQVNSYVLQVEPDRFKKRDKARLTYREALRVETARNECFKRLMIGMPE